MITVRKIICGISEIRAVKQFDWYLLYLGDSALLHFILFYFILFYFIYSFICLFIYLFVYLFIYLSIYSFIGSFIYFSIRLHDHLPKSFHYNSFLVILLLLLYYYYYYYCYHHHYYYYSNNYNYHYYSFCNQQFRIIVRILFAHCPCLLIGWCRYKWNF